LALRHHGRMQSMRSEDGRIELRAAPALLEKLQACGALTDAPPIRWRGAAASDHLGRARHVVLRLDGAAPIVVKPLRHGGLPARSLGEAFAGAARLESAVALAQRLRERGVATPTVELARVRRAALLPWLCRLDLGTSEVGASRDALAFLRASP